METKWVIIFFTLYGGIIAVAYHFHSQVVHESSLFLLNYFVENNVLPLVILYFANDLGNPLVRNEILAFRIILSVAFWGGTSGIAYAGLWAINRLIRKN